ncbi:unnamed protein product [Arctia plantaginis]|uniref:Uncharacterized protein n=1 Tax=Arctia plantaginis TaxID=874455 RepID=A0A8S1A0V9_ARCPL|nr:unnamed protein product [Arctia plantaginis]
MTSAYIPLGLVFVCYSITVNHQERNDINAKYVILILTSCVSGPISLMQPMTPVIHSQHLMGLAGPGEDHSFLAGLLLKYFTSKYSKGTCTTFGTPSKCFPNISVHNII